MNHIKNKKVFTIICIVVVFVLVGTFWHKNDKVDTKKVDNNTQINTLVAKKVNTTQNNTNTVEKNNVNNQDQNTNTTLDVDACDLSGNRVPNAVVKVGFGQRNYYAYTNNSAQLIEVKAQSLSLQNNSEAKYKGRYCPDEAKVAGTELAQYDQGHVIADSLGGVSNAYNITPQDAYLNRHGFQAQMEKELRDAMHNNIPVSDFDAKIIYPNNETMIPSSYKIHVKIGTTYKDFNFDNNTGESTTQHTNTSQHTSRDVNSQQSVNTNTNQSGLHWSKNHRCFQYGHVGSLPSSVCESANI